MAKLKTSGSSSDVASIASQSSPHSPRPSTPSSIISSTAVSVVTAPETQMDNMDFDEDERRPPHRTLAGLQIPRINTSRSTSRSRSRPRSPSRPRRNPNDPYPPFLLQSREDIRRRFVDLNHVQEELIAGHNALKESFPYGDMTQMVTARNRYGNVEVYHGNRISLKVPEGTSDYINASPIVLERYDGDESPSRYIATQGPKDTTAAQFWQMIWEQSKDSAIIIMLTKFNENNQPKCFDYLPQPDHDPMSIHINELSESTEPDYTVTLVSSSFNKDITGSLYREIALREEESQETRRVLHYAFEDWPDFSVPEGNDRQKLVRLLKEIRGLAEEHSNSPRVVHCSAGVGRSGTFIALDFLFRLLDEQRLQKSQIPPGQDLIYDVVEKLRTQRMMMVQGEQQYALIYNTLREEIERRWYSGELSKDS